MCLLLGTLGPPYLGADVLKGGRAHQGEADQKDILQRKGTDGTDQRVSKQSVSPPHTGTTQLLELALLPPTV